VPVTGLARCVGDVQQFLEQKWGRAPLHCPASSPTGFDDLFSLDDVDRLVTSSFARTPAFRLVRDGKPIDPSRYTRSARLGGRSVSGVGDPRRVLEELDAGATIVLQGLQRYWPPLTRFCRALELELTHPVQANAYITPASARGLAVHYDTHDVFVLQVAGAKEWSIHEPVFTDPLASQPWSTRRGKPGPAILEPRLRTGDSLYVPRGFLHCARAQEELSAHLTIGVLTHTVQDVVKELISGTAEDGAFRRSLPAGFADDVDGLAQDVEKTIEDLRTWLESVDAKAVAQTVARRFWSSRQPVLAGQLRQLLSLDRITDASVACRREGAVCHLEARGTALRVLLGDRELSMPAVLETAVRRVANGHPFRVGDLHDLLDGPSRLVLVRRLVREGLLEILEPGAG
jgi:lysine-specific demethylase/histidyl-hydroxylase NO66